MEINYEELGLLDMGKTNRHSGRPNHFVEISDLEKVLEECKKLGATSVGVFLQEQDMRYGANNFKVFLEMSRKKSNLELLEMKKTKLRKELNEIDHKIEEERSSLGSK